MVRLSGVSSSVRSTEASGSTRRCWTRISWLTRSRASWSVRRSPSLATGNSTPLVGELRWCNSRRMDVIHDLEAELQRIEALLASLDHEQWLTESAAAGWTVADVVLHLAQSEEAVVDSTGGRSLFEGRTFSGNTVDEIMDNWVRSERAEPQV